LDCAKVAIFSGRKKELTEKSTSEKKKKFYDLILWYNFEMDDHLSQTADICNYVTGVLYSRV
jgi:hypothetical protein